MVIVNLKRSGLAACLVLALLVGASAGQAVVTDVNEAELNALIERGVKIVDVRRADEWRETGVIAGSTLITAFDANGQFDPEFGARFQAEVAPDQAVAVICRSGRRSAIVSDLLTRQAGYTNVYNARGGIVGWLAAGNPVDPCPAC